jgi:TRAP-type C4-dicarboxylate transport system substrate-binding protein
LDGSDNTFPEVQAEYKDVKLLFLHTTNTKMLMTTKKPVKNREDLKGMKIIDIAGYQFDTWRLLGASPMLIPAPDIYTAAERGVGEANIAPWAGIGSWRWYEVFRYYTDVSCNVTTFQVIMNIEKWNSLPPDIQQAITSVSNINGGEFASQTAYGFDEAADVAAMMQKAGKVMQKVSLDAGEFDKWKEIGGKPLWDKWVADCQAKGIPAKKILDESLRLLEKYK